MLSGFTDAKATALSTSHIRQAGSKSPVAASVFLLVWEKCLRREEECIRCEFSYFSFFFFFPFFQLQMKSYIARRRPLKTPLFIEIEQIYQRPDA